MSDRPTPETNAFFKTFADGLVAPSHAEYFDRLIRLERERDEAREQRDRLAEQMRENPWCASCLEKDCCVSGDGTCAMIRKYLAAVEGDANDGMTSHYHNQK